MPIPPHMHNSVLEKAPVGAFCKAFCFCLRLLESFTSESRELRFHLSQCRIPDKIFWMVVLLTPNSPAIVRWGRPSDFMDSICSSVSLQCALATPVAFTSNPVLWACKVFSECVTHSRSHTMLFRATGFDQYVERRIWGWLGESNPRFLLHR